MSETEGEEYHAFCGVCDWERDCEGMDQMDALDEVQSRVTAHMVATGHTNINIVEQ